MALSFAKLAFTPTVRAEQEKRGSAEGYAKFLSDERQGGDVLTMAEATFLLERDGFYMSTVFESGWPYVQFRGGPAGFIKLLDEKTIGFADLAGNRQYLSTGNMRANPRVALIAMDYPNARRLKLWGRVRIIEAEDNPEAAEALRPQGSTARIERLVLITVEAFDWNCPRHIPRRLTVEEFGGETLELRKEVERLKAALAQATSTTA